MKEFLKYVFATVAGIGLFIALATVIGFVSLIGMGASEQDSIRNFKFQPDMGNIVIDEPDKGDYHFLFE